VDFSLWILLTERIVSPMRGKEEEEGETLDEE